MRCRPWSDERLAILNRDWPGNRPRAEILAALNVLPGPTISMAGLLRKVLREGIKRSPGFLTGGEPVNTERNREILRRIAAGENRADIAKVYGVTVSLVHDVVYKARRFQQHPDLIQRLPPRDTSVIFRDAPARTFGSPTVGIASGDELLVWTYCEIEAWARPYGLSSPTHGFDIVKVNEFRAEHGLRPLRIRRSQPGVYLPRLQAREMVL